LIAEIDVTGVVTEINENNNVLEISNCPATPPS